MTRSMSIRTISAALASLFLLSACAGSFETSYAKPPPAEVTQTWRVVDVNVITPEGLTVSTRNSFAPSADIVWWGDLEGDRRAQVADIVDAGITAGAAGLTGSRPVTITARLDQFHAVTPMAVSRAPAAVHNISYEMQVFDQATGKALTSPALINADLDAYVGAQAIAAAVEGQTQKVRITNHIALVTRSWLGIGPDPRRKFTGLGR